jgi:hypothetical protein
MHEIKCSHWSLFIFVCQFRRQEVRRDETERALAFKRFQLSIKIEGGAVRQFRSVVFITSTAFHTSNYSSMLGALPAGSAFMYRASLPLSLSFDGFQSEGRRETCLRLRG